MSSSSFTPTSLSTWIHQHLPHYTSSLSRISPDEITPNYVVDDHTDTYATSLGILAFLLFCWFPIYVLIELFIRFIYCCCCRSNNHHHHSPHIEGSSRHLQHHSKHVKIRWHICAAIAALVCAAGLATSYQQHTETTKGMKTVISSLDNISHYQHSLLTDLARIRITLNDSSVILDTLINPERDNDTLPSGILDILTNVQTEIDNIQDECEQVENQGSSFTLNETLHVMRDEEKTRDSSVISLLTLVVVLLFLLMAFYWCCLRLSSTCRGIMQVITVFILGITLIYACVLVGLSLGASDVCQQPDTYADYIISSRTSGEATLILEYYLYCDARANPITPRVEKAIVTAGALSASLVVLNHTVSTQYPAIYADIRPSIDALFIDAAVVDSTLIQTSMKLDCKHAHEEYQHAVEAGCQRVLDGTFIMGVVLGLSVIFFLLFRLCLRVRTPPPLDDSFSFSYQPLSAQPSPSMRAQTSFHTYATPTQTGYVRDPLQIHTTSMEDSREGQSNTTEGYYFYPQERR